ncbi:MAG: zf-TFIIB domain-containing protein [Planctomycetes bacterium]|nr:zf-TFIIB domain-containing protein [Planctomycetota bacterium]
MASETNRSRANEPRRCPRDGAAMRHEQGFGAIELDRCRDCDALWFDGGELARWSAARGRQPDVPDSATHAAVAAPASCPACVAPTLAWLEWQGARLGGCARCRGLFVPPELQQRLDRPLPPDAMGPAAIEPPRDVPTWGEIGGAGAEMFVDALTVPWPVWLLQRIKRLFEQGR